MFKASSTRFSVRPYSCIPHADYSGSISIDGSVSNSSESVSEDSDSSNDSHDRDTISTTPSPTADTESCSGEFTTTPTPTNTPMTAISSQTPQVPVRHTPTPRLTVDLSTNATRVCWAHRVEEVIVIDPRDVKRYVQRGRINSDDAADDLRVIYAPKPARPLVQLEMAAAGDDDPVPLDRAGIDSGDLPFEPTVVPLESEALIHGGDEEEVVLYPRTSETMTDNHSPAPFPIASRGSDSPNWRDRASGPALVATPSRVEELVSTPYTRSFSARFLHLDAIENETALNELLPGEDLLVNLTHKTMRRRALSLAVIHPPSRDTAAPPSSTLLRRELVSNALRSRMSGSANKVSLPHTHSHSDDHLENLSEPRIHAIAQAYFERHAGSAKGMVVDLAKAIMSRQYPSTSVVDILRHLVKLLERVEGSGEERRERAELEGKFGQFVLEYFARCWNNPSCDVLDRIFVVQIVGHLHLDIVNDVLVHFARIPKDRLTRCHVEAIVHLKSCALTSTLSRLDQAVENRIL